jgi:hypothetical protein
MLELMRTIEQYRLRLARLKFGPETTNQSKFKDCSQYLLRDMYGVLPLRNMVESNIRWQPKRSQ